MAVTGAILVDSSVLSKETQKIRFIISMETTAQEIITKILQRFNMNGRDPNLFYITMETQNKQDSMGQPVKSLQNSSHPLEMQLHNGGNVKFAVQMRSGGVVKVYDNCLTSASFYKSMFISKYTTSYQLIQLLLNHYGVSEGPENFLLASIDDNGKELRELAKLDCPLQLQQQSVSKISFSLKRVKKTSNLTRPHSFHGESASDQRQKDHRLNILRRSLRKKGKNIRFDFDQADEEREEAIEQLRSNLHQLTNNKESVFFNFQKSATTSKAISLDKNDHKEFLRAKMENLKQRKLIESRRQSDTSVLESLEGMFENDDVIQRRLHRTSHVENDRNSLNLEPVNGLGKENRLGSETRDDFLSSDSSGMVTPVLKDDFEQRLNRENGEAEERRRRSSVDLSEEIIQKEPNNNIEGCESDNEKLISNTNSRRNSKLGEAIMEPQGQNGLKGQILFDPEKTPLVTPRTPFQTPRVNLVPGEQNTLGVPSSDPYGSPTPTASGRDSRISSVSDLPNASFDSSGAPTPTPKMEDYSSVEKESFTQAVKAKNTMAAIEETKEVEKTLQSSDTESEAGSASKVKTGAKNQRSKSTEKNSSPKKNIPSLPSVGSTPIQTPRIDLKKSKASSESKSSGQESESDTKSKSRSSSVKTQGPPQNTAKRKETRGRIQNPDTPPQTPRLARSRTHSTETPVRSRTSSKVEDTPRSRKQSRTDGMETPRSRTQSRADETPLRTPRTNSHAEESAEEIMTPRSRSTSTTSQSGRSDAEGQGQRSRKMPSARSNVRNKGGSLSDSESLVARKTSRGASSSRSEESLRKAGTKGTEQEKNASRDTKGSRGPAVRRPNASGYSSDKTSEKVSPRKTLTSRKDSSTSDLESSSKESAPRKKSSTQKTREDTNKTEKVEKGGENAERRTSSTKEFREIVTDRLYQLSRTPSTRRKNYKPPEKKGDDDASTSDTSTGRWSSVSSVSSAATTPSVGDADGQRSTAARKTAEVRTTRGQGQTKPRQEVPGQKPKASVKQTHASSGYSSDAYRKSSNASLASEDGVKPSTGTKGLRKMNSMTSEDESFTDGSVISDADNTSAKESFTSDVDAQDENGLQRRRRRRPRRALPAIPNMGDVDLEERKKQLFSGAKQRLQRVYYDSESSMTKSDIDSQSERGEGNASRASTLTGKDEDERLPLYLISASSAETEDTADDRLSIESSAFESPKSDDEEIMNVILRGQQRTNFTAELVPPIKTDFSQPDSRSGSKVGTHTEEQIYKAKQNLLKGINVTFKSKPPQSARGYRTDAEEETRGSSTARASSGYVSDQPMVSRKHVNAGNLGRLLVKGGADTAGIPKHLVPLDAGQEKLVAAKYQFLQQQFGNKLGSLKQEIQDPLATPRMKRNLVNTQTQTDFKKSNYNRPSLQKVLKSCDLFHITIERGRYLYFGIRLFEGVFQPLSSPHSLRSPRGKRPLIGQNKSAFSRVRPMAVEDEIESIISVDKIGDRTAARLDGRVQEGDYVMEVNGHYVMDRSLMEVQGALEMSGTKLDLVIARTKVLNLAKEDIGLAPHTDLEKELEKLKLKYNNVLEESQQKDRLIEELRSVIVKKAQIRQVKDGIKNCKINVEILEGECSAV